MWQMRVTDEEGVLRASERRLQHSLRQPPGRRYDSRDPRACPDVCVYPTFCSPISFQVSGALGTALSSSSFSSDGTATPCGSGTSAPPCPSSTHISTVSIACNMCPSSSVAGGQNPSGRCAPNAGRRRGGRHAPSLGRVSVRHASSTMSSNAPSNSSPTSPDAPPPPTPPMPDEAIRPGHTCRAASR